MGVVEDLELILSKERLNEDGIASASIAVLENGQLSAHVITSRHENTDTVYQAYSISKAITSLAVAKLVGDGRLSYYTKIINHLPGQIIDCIVDNHTRHLMEHVTVAMLLSHTSGLSQHGFPGYADANNMPSTQDIFSGQPPSNTPRVRFMAVPGAQWSYTGGGFTILQLVLEDLTKMPFAHFMQETLLKPLDMTRSWYGAKPDDERNYAQAYITASVRFPRAADYHSFVELPAAGLWTTPSDLLKAVSAIQKSLHSDAGFLTQETAKKMLTGVSTVSELEDMALAWFVNPRAYGHAGDNDPGYSTYVCGLPGEDSAQSDGKGFAIMTNSALGHDRAIKKITSAIFFLKSWPPFHALPSHFGKDDYVPYAAKLGSVVNENGWKEWIGRWGSDWQLVDENGPAWKYKEMDTMEMSPAPRPCEDLMMESASSSTWLKDSSWV